MKHRRFLLLPIILILTWLVLAGTALAHASLVESDPAEGSALDASPPKIKLTFNEQVEADFSGIAVYDQSGARVDLGDSRVAPDNVQRVEVGLKPLTTGYYTVSWKVVSADGHLVKGAYTFAIGHPAGAAQAVDAATPGAAAGPPLRTLAWHWLHLSSLILLAGTALFRAFVLPAAGVAPGGAGLIAAAVGRLRRMTAWLAGVFYVAAAAVLVDHAATVSDRSFWQALRPDLLLKVALHTKWGQSWLAGLVLAALLTVALRVQWRAWAGAVLAGLLLFTLSLGGHAGAQTTGTLQALAADWLHLLATATWVGGLLCLLLSLPRPDSEGSPQDRSGLTSSLVRRFTPLAAGSVAVLILTGVYTALLRIPTWGAVPGTSYGRTLVVKLLLFAGTGLIGAVNYLVMSPRFRLLAAESTAAAAQAAQRTLRRLVGVELAGGLAVLAAVAVLTSVAPARAVWIQPFDAKGAAGDLQVAVHMTPNKPGFNRMTVQVTDSTGAPPTDILLVRLRFAMLEHEMGELTADATQTGPGAYALGGSQISMPGRWRLDVVVRRNGKEDVKASFLMQVQDFLS